jgi:DNA-binding transcriptional MerR regulator
VSAKTIRHYLQIGVLPPPARTPSGYRAYDDGVLDRLRFVRAAQAVGLTLGEIREIVALRDRGWSPAPTSSRSSGDGRTRSTSGSRRYSGCAPTSGASTGARGRSTPRPEQTVGGYAALS